MNTQDNSRAEFEKFASNILGLSIEKLINFCDGYIDNLQYEDTRTNDAWLTWQAARAIPADAAKSVWRTIDSAPKNVDVLVFAHGRQYVALLVDDASDPFFKEGQAESDFNGLWTVDDNKHGPYALRGYSPTYWMPLPLAPDA